MQFQIELPPTAKRALAGFLPRERLMGLTRLVRAEGNECPRYLFGNKAMSGKSAPEVISRYHPAKRFIREQYRATGGRSFHPVVAAVVAAEDVAPTPCGVHVSSVARWSMEVGQPRPVLSPQAGPW